MDLVWQHGQSWCCAVQAQPLADKKKVAAEEERKRKAAAIAQVRMRKSFKIEQCSQHQAGPY